MSTVKKILAALFVAAFLAATGCGDNAEEEPAARGDHVMGGYTRAVDKARDAEQNVKDRQEDVEKRLDQLNQ
ncbi:MAG: hypothetical protein ACLFOY_03190 [Desulfatibacillaceae bacterium]